MTESCAACRFIRLLPEDICGPEVTVDQDGEILFEWLIGHRQTFAVSVSDKGMLNYAGLNGEDSICGTEQLTDTIPEVILTFLRWIHA